MPTEFESQDFSEESKHDSSDTPVSKNEEISSISLYNFSDEAILNSGRLPDISKTFDNFGSFSPHLQDPFVGLANQF